METDYGKKRFTFALICIEHVCLFAEQLKRIGSVNAFINDFAFDFASNAMNFTSCQFGQHQSSKVVLNLQLSLSHSKSRSNE